MNNRELMCIDSLKKVKEKFPEIVDLYNVMFDSDTDALLEGFINDASLKNHFTIQNKKLPYVNDIIDVVCNKQVDYILFINNDILVSDRFIKQILNNTEIDCFPASRLHFTKLDSIDDTESTPQAFSVHGFDGFCLKKTWWKAHKHFFKRVILGRGYWDTYFFAKCMIHGKCKVLNKPPAVLFHLEHNSTSTATDEGNKYNETQFLTDPDNVANKWYSYVYSVLLKRPTYKNILWYTPFVNEEELEQTYFNK